VTAKIKKDVVQKIFFKGRKNVFGVKKLMFLRTKIYIFEYVF